jgi:hypothetical protein
MIRRILAADIATAAFTAVVVVSSAAPTTAAVVNFEDLAGNFAGDEAPRPPVVPSMASLLMTGVT